MSQSAAAEMRFSLEPPYELPLFANALHTVYTKQFPPWISLPDALSPRTTKALRQLVKPMLQEHDRPDRARYRFVDLITHVGESPQLPMSLALLLASLREFAANVSGKSLRQGPARIVWLERGDYALRLDDALSRSRENFIEATLDLSPAPGDPSACVYSEMPFIHLPIAQLPGQISLVERSLANHRFDRFRNCLSGHRAFVLLRAEMLLTE